MNNAYKNIFSPASILIGTIIGAGMFSLPFVFKAAGLATGIFYLLFFGIIYIFLYFIYADLILRTSGSHRFVGLAKLYFGKAGFWLTVFSSLLQQIFVLTIYLILAPSFSQVIIGGRPLYHFLAFWLLGSAIILFKAGKIALFEFLINVGMLSIIGLVFLAGLKDFPAAAMNYWGEFDFSKIMVVGPVLFALSGALAVPEMIDCCREGSVPISYLKKAMILGGVLPVIAYFLFVLGIFGLTDVVSEDAVSGLIGRIPEFLLLAIAVLGFLSLLSSYAVVGLNSRKILQLDFNLPLLAPKLLVISLPPLFYFLGFKNFIEGVSFVGSIFLPLESILIIFMWLKADKSAEAPRIFAGKLIKMSIPILLLVFFMALLYILY